MTEHDRVKVLARGSWGKVVGLQTADGTCPAFEWLQSLDTRQQAAMKARLDMLAERGWLVNPSSYRTISSDKKSPTVDEVKHVPENLRLYVIKGNRVFYATHGGKKPKKSGVASEVARARKIYEEWK